MDRVSEQTPATQRACRKNEDENQHAPWYIVPADDKENARLIVSQIVRDAVNALKMVYPTFGLAALRCRDPLFGPRVFRFNFGGIGEIC